MNTASGSGSGTERRRKTKATQKPQKDFKENFWVFFCDLCETFATSAFGTRTRTPEQEAGP